MSVVVVVLFVDDSKVQSWNSFHYFLAPFLSLLSLSHVSKTRWMGSQPRDKWKRKWEISSERERRREREREWERREREGVMIKRKKDFERKKLSKTARERRSKKERESNKRDCCFNFLDLAFIFKIKMEMFLKNWAICSLFFLFYVFSTQFYYSW